MRWDVEIDEIWRRGRAETASAESPRKAKQSHPDAQLSDWMVSRRLPPGASRSACAARDTGPGMTSSADNDLDILINVPTSDLCLMPADVALQHDWTGLPSEALGRCLFVSGSRFFFFFFFQRQHIDKLNTSAVKNVVMPMALASNLLLSNPLSLNAFLRVRG